MAWPCGPAAKQGLIPGASTGPPMPASIMRGMEIITALFDFVLHVDRYLETFVTQYGPWVYALLFIIVFVETGVVVMPFLPGDSLIFVVGALCGVGLMSYPIACGVLMVAAVLGDQSNYMIGRYLGPKVFQWESSRFFNKRAFDQAHAFYEKYGGFTIIAARFMPFIRTFAPFVAGVASMDRAKFSLFNVLGAFLWVFGIATAGYFLGSVPWVKQNLDKIIWGLILVPGLIFVAGALKARYGKPASSV
jgi:membrane-associated protein